MDDSLSNDRVYKEWLKELKLQIRRSQAKASVRVNSALLELYWSIGSDIVEKQEQYGWGSGVISQLSRDLRAEFPDVKGFSITNLQYAKRFYSLYSQCNTNLVLHWDREKQDQLGVVSKQGEKTEVLVEPTGLLACSSIEVALTSVPWRHHVEIIIHTDSMDEALFYVFQTIEGGWSRERLKDNLRSDLFSRKGKAPNNFLELLPSPQGDLAKEVLKDPYSFDFISIADSYRERELENALVDNITDFLLELGQGFAYVGKQVPIAVGSKDLAIDLLFYHLEIRSYIVIELKAVEFDAAFTGQLGVYVAAVDRQLKKDIDNPTIGLLICKTKDNVYAEYSLRSSSQPIGISAYELTKLVPDDFKSSLPSIEEIESTLSE